MIEVLIAVYQGEKYLREQLDSIVNQSFKDWRISIRDDGSSDGTADIISEYIKRYPDKIRLIDTKTSVKGSKSNFMELLKCADDEYVMLCDQDDIWDKDKLKLMMNRMYKLEERYGKELPLLIASNLEVVDESLNPLPDICLDADRRRLALNYLLVENQIPGCTMMLNRTLCKALSGINPDKIIMHDWIITLYACCFGKISVMPQRLVKYRQHAENVSGAVKKKSISFAIKKLFDKDIKKAYEKLYDQAEEFYACFGKALNEADRKTMCEFISMRNKNKLMKISTTIRGRYVKSGLFRFLGQIFYV